MEYRPVEGWGKLPEGYAFVEATSVAVDAKDNLVKAEEELGEIKKILAEADEDLDFLKTQSSLPGDTKG